MEATMEALVVALVLVAILATGAIVQIFRFEKELRRMAQFLDSRTIPGASRMTTRLRTKGFLTLGKAINRQLALREGDACTMREKDRELRDGFAYLSHDIRTPLMGARGYLQLELVNRTEHVGSASVILEESHYLAAVDERLLTLEEILTQLFLFTQVSSDDYPLNQQRLLLSEELGLALVSFYPQFKERNWEPVVMLENEAIHPSYVEADPEALRRIIDNILINMLRHGSGEPRIEQHGATTVFSNSMANPSALDESLLFARFYKGEQSGSSKGSGLGLTIVATLAQAMGASIEARVEDDRFIIILSCAEAR